MEVELQDKQRFFHWFIETVKFQKREVYWIINYLLNHEAILKKVKVVEYAEKTPRGLVFNAEHNEESLILYLNGLTFTNPEQIFHEIRMNWKKDLYISCVFLHAWQIEEYVSVLEDNPFFSWNDNVDTEVVQKIESFLQSEKETIELSEIYEKIDHALESGDEKLFEQLTAQLKKKNN